MKKCDTEWKLYGNYGEIHSIQIRRKSKWTRKDTIIDLYIILWFFVFYVRGTSILELDFVSDHKAIELMSDTSTFISLGLWNNKLRTCLCILIQVTWKYRFIFYRKALYSTLTSCNMHHSHIVIQNGIIFSFLITKVMKCWNSNVDTSNNNKYKYLAKLQHVSSINTVNMNGEGNIAQSHVPKQNQVSQYNG